MSTTGNDPGSVSQVKASKRSTAGVAIAVLAGILLLACLATGSRALSMVNDGSQSGLNFLITALSLVLFFVGSLLSLLRGSRATVLFVIAAIGFVYSAIKWYFPDSIALVCAFGAIASLVAIVTPFLARE